MEDKPFADFTKEEFEEQVRQTAKDLFDQEIGLIINGLKYDAPIFITSITGYIDLVILGVAGDITEQQKAFLETARQNTSSLKILIHDTVAAIKAVSLPSSLRFQGYDVSALFTSLVESYSDYLLEEKRNLHLTSKIEGYCPPVYTDFDYLYEPLNILIRNAIQHTPDNGTLSLTAQYIRDENKITITVSDTGMGIDDEIRDQIFSPIVYRRKTRSRTGKQFGAGLELFRAKKYIQHINGEIWFESEVDKGTTFYVKIPAAKKDN